MAEQQELMTPGAWEKQGFTYRLSETTAPPAPKDDGAGARLDGMRNLGIDLLRFASKHDGRFPATIGDVRDEMTADREGQRAVRIGAPDPMSVMNYRNEPPQLQQSDIESTRQFYSMTEDANGKSPMIGMTQVIDYTPL